MFTYVMYTYLSLANVKLQKLAEVDPAPDKSHRTGGPVVQYLRNIRPQRKHRARLLKSKLVIKKSQKKMTTPKQHVNKTQEVTTYLCHEWCRYFYTVNYVSLCAHNLFIPVQSLIKVKAKIPTKMKLTLLQTTIQLEVTMNLLMKTVQLGVVTKRRIITHTQERKPINWNKHHPVLQVLMKVHLMNTLIECFTFPDLLRIVTCGMHGPNTSMEHSKFFYENLYHIEYSYSVLVQGTSLGYSFRIFYTVFTSNILSEIHIRNVSKPFIEDSFRSLVKETYLEYY